MEREQVEQLVCEAAERLLESTTVLTKRPVRMSTAPAQAKRLAQIKKAGTAYIKDRTKRVSRAVSGSNY